jgi:hypothetical protein
MAMSGIHLTVVGNRRQMPHFAHAKNVASWRNIPISLIIAIGAF